MRFPLAHEPFPPVVLSPEQCMQYERLASALLRETLDEYEDFVHRDRRQIDRKKWKEVKTKENIAIYKSTRRDQVGSTPTVSAGDTPMLRSMDWNVPKVIGIGTIVGTLDDIMYAVLSPNDTAVKVKTTYVKDEVADWRVLAQLKGPTEDEPFRFLGIKWSVVEQFIHKFGVWPRDLVFLDSSGIRIMPDGERMGYVVYHSVEAPQCGELTSIGVMRCRMSYQFLYRETGVGTVELYMRAYVDGGGSMADAVAVYASTVSAIGTCKLSMCAQNKKLAWLMREATTDRTSQVAFAKSRVESARACPLCLKSLTGFRSSWQCALCNSTMCSRCLTTRKLTNVLPTGQLIRVPTSICKTCIMRATTASASEIAVLEHVPGARARRKASGVQPDYLTNWDSSSWRSGSNTSGSAGQVEDDVDGDLSTNVTLDDDADLLDIEGFDPVHRQSRSSRKSASAAPPTPKRATPTPVDDARQRELWAQMNQLRIAAEEAYMQTKRNENAMNQSQSRSRK